MKKTVFLWDIDGTLLLTGGSGGQAFDRVFEELYQESDIWQNYQPHGLTDYIIIEDIFSARFGRSPLKDEIEKISQLYIRYLKEFLKDAPRFQIMPAAVEVVHQISQNPNFVQGLCTGNFEEAIMEQVKSQLDQ